MHTQLIVALTACLIASAASAQTPTVPTAPVATETPQGFSVVSGNDNLMVYIENDSVKSDGKTVSALVLFLTRQPLKYAYSIDSTSKAMCLDGYGRVTTKNLQGAMSGGFDGVYLGRQHRR
jgi:hypothetical protein